MKKYLLIPALGLFLLACDNDANVDANADDGKDTTVVIHKDASDNTTDENTSSSEDEDQGDSEENASGSGYPNREDWKPKMDEYHDLVCKENKGTATTSDRIRMGELTIEINKMRKDLDEEEQLQFAADMARAGNTETCI